MSVSNIYLKLVQCHDISDISNFTKELHCAPIGLLGGRRFYQKGVAGTVCLNDVVKKLKQISEGVESKMIPGGPDKTKEIIEKIKDLDGYANAELSDCWIFKRFFTWIRQMLGNSNYDRKIVLASIENTIEIWKKNIQKCIEEIKLEAKNQEIAQKKKEKESALNKLSIDELINQLELPPKEEEFLEIKKNLLKKKIRESLHSNPMGLEIQSAFQKLVDDSDKFKQLAILVSVSSQLGWYHIAEFLEAIVWPSEESKEEVIPLCIANTIFAANAAYAYSDQLLIENKNSVKVKRVLLDFRRIVGRRDFNKDPDDSINFSSLKAKGIATVFKEIAEDTREELEEAVKAGKTADAFVGIKIEIGQYTECRFPASLISPILPYLKSIPGLMSIDMSDIGIELHQEEPKGFSNHDAKAILELIEQNPSLMEIRINHSAMSGQDLLDVTDAIQKINDNPNKQVLVDNILEEVKG